MTWMSAVAPKGLAVLLIGVLLVAGCGRAANDGSPMPNGTSPASAEPSSSATPNPTASLQPLTKEQAIAVARGFAGVPPSAVVFKAEAGPFAQFDANPNGKMSPPPADHWVWHIEFGDSGGIMSGAIIDYVSGALVETYRAIPN
jgi:hypothetical protein